MIKTLQGPLLLVGDIHGNFDYVTNLHEEYSDSTIIQIGDFGIGFGNDVPNQFDKYNRLYWIAGNHDDRNQCVRHSGYLGHYGWFQWYPLVDHPKSFKVFYISGAWSIDRAVRTPGIDWWHYEELSRDEMVACQEMYNEVKPDIVISHDSPSSCWSELIKRTKMLFGDQQRLTRTGEFLEQLRLLHSPSRWYFGHYHPPRNLSFIQNEIEYNCLRINGISFL